MSLFETAAKKFEDNTAIIFADKKITYRELDKKSDDIAAYILQKNISVGDCRIDFNSALWVYADNSDWSIKNRLRIPAAWFYLPAWTVKLYNKRRVGENLNHDERIRNLITDYDGEILFIDDIPHAEKITVPEIQPENIFILLYTSGSMGIPKGVKHLHKNFVCFINWYKKFYNLT